MHGVIKFLELIREPSSQGNQTVLISMRDKNLRRNRMQTSLPWAEPGKNGQLSQTALRNP